MGARAGRHYRIGNDGDLESWDGIGFLSAARKVRPDIILLCHGGPISMPDDAAYVLARADRIHGFYGASSAERLPAERAIADQIRAFKSIPAKG